MKKEQYNIKYSIIVITILAVNLIVCKRESQNIELSATEKSWLNERRGKIKLAPESNYPPFIFSEKEDVYKGISMDYVKLIEDKIGFQFNITKGRPLSYNLNKAKKGEVDVITSLKKNSKRSEFLLFTQPYIDFANIILVRKENQKNLKLKDLKKMKIAVGKGYAVHNYLQKNYNYLNLELVSDDSVSLRMLSFKEVDALVMNQATASYLIEKEGIVNLRVAGKTNFSDKLSIASRKDLPILNSILEKGLNRITKKERKEIFEKWIHVGSKSIFDRKEFWIVTFSVFGFLGFITGAVLTWSRALRIKVHQKTLEIKNHENQLAELVAQRTKELTKSNRLLTKEVTDRRQFELSLKQSEEQLSNVLETLSIPLFVSQMQGDKVLFANASFSDALGYSAEDITDLKAVDFINIDDRQNLIQSILRKGSLSNYELQITKRSGASIWALLSVQKIVYGNENALLTGFNDISKRKHIEAQINHRATHDVLTSLPNRDLFNDRLGLALNQAKRDNSKLAVMFLDLDGFKKVNDTLGHDVGDLVLQESTDNLIHSVRKGDTVSRLGGDEFAILLRDVKSPEIASKVAKKILEKFQSVFTIGGNEIDIGISIGISIFPDHAENPEKLLKMADNAMYQVKNKTKNSYEFPNVF